MTVSSLIARAVFERGDLEAFGADRAYGKPTERIEIDDYGEVVGLHGDVPQTNQIRFNRMKQPNLADNNPMYEVETLQVGEIASASSRQNLASRSRDAFGLSQVLGRCATHGRHFHR